MVDLKAKPYYLDDEGVKWVMDTIASMSDEEKVGQLFVNMVTSDRPEDIKKVVDNYHPGALRYRSNPAERLWEQNNNFQKMSRIPLLIASNCEQGGNGGVGGGTYVSCGAATAASKDPECAYLAAKVGGTEAMAIGSNWNFAPIVDLLYNWRNTIVQLRSFCHDVDETITYAKAFFKGERECNVATCIKHFPGDGTEENDQHLMMGINDMDCDTWMNTFGRVYKELIDDGVMTVMAGHIAQPAWQRALAGHPVADEEILPATECKELITGLLKEKLGFNGLVVTDASHMIGMFASGSRAEQVPGAIAAGCDMFLFFNDMEEDFGYMMDGYKNGVITEERMQDALMRILGVKAAIGLHKKQADGTLMPPKEGISVVGCKEHKQIAAYCVDKAITLVKDTKHYLPLNPEKSRKLRVVYLAGDGHVVAGKLEKPNDAPMKNLIRTELEAAGFEVTYADDPEIVAKGKGKMEQFRKECDAVLVISNQVGFAQQNSMRVKWTLPTDQPWYASQVPTIFVSLNLANLLIDMTMSHCYINAYNASPEVVHALVEKLVGKSEFKGTPDENVWCGRWDTKL
ncbi:MAG: glycoside hydrolase family 3 protein [Lachnospiraceae bacterium]